MEERLAELRDRVPLALDLKRLSDRLTDAITEVVETKLRTFGWTD